LSASAQAAEGPTPLWRHAAFRWTLIAAGLAALAAPLWWGPLSQGLFQLEFAVAELLPRETIAASAWFLLPLVGFAAGLLASLSPCILPLVPLNVAYIGAAEAEGAPQQGHGQDGVPGLGEPLREHERVRAEHLEQLIGVKQASLPKGGGAVTGAEGGAQRTLRVRHRGEGARRLGPSRLGPPRGGARGHERGQALEAEGQREAGHEAADVRAMGHAAAAGRRGGAVGSVPGQNLFALRRSKLPEKCLLG